MRISDWSSDVFSSDLAAARLIGFGTNEGSVAAATDWGGVMEVKQVNPSRPGSYEQLCHEAGHPRFLVDLREGTSTEARARSAERRVGKESVSTCRSRGSPYQ